MTTYKLLIDSPKFAKKLDEIKRLAKRQKKQVAIMGNYTVEFVCLPQIYFSNVLGYRSMRDRDRGKKVSGEGIIVQVV